MREARKEIICGGAKAERHLVNTVEPWLELNRTLERWQRHSRHDGVGVAPTCQRVDALAQLSEPAAHGGLVERSDGTEGMDAEAHGQCDE
jgi:hypothetical protein